MVTDETTKTPRSRMDARADPDHRSVWNGGAGPARSTPAKWFQRRNPDRRRQIPDMHFHDLQERGAMARVNVIAVPRAVC
jgi:hypothetical protein